VTPETAGDLSLSTQEALLHIDRYLNKADLLAELPQFQGVHFTGDELSDLSGLSIPSPELESQLEITLTPLRKREILKVLQKFIRSYTVPLVANQAMAIFITLGEVILWHRHAFIKRLLIVSIQEAKVYASLQQKDLCFAIDY
jgi:hypothetical protein